VAGSISERGRENTLEDKKFNWMGSLGSVDYPWFWLVLGMVYSKQATAINPCERL
jgi:hypothetical protein